MLTLCSAEINRDKAENNTHPQSLKISTEISPPRFFLLCVSPQVMTPFSSPALLKCIVSIMVTDCSGEQFLHVGSEFWDVLCEANQGL